jgi:hypothetical protein
MNSANLNSIGIQVSEEYIVSILLFHPLSFPIYFMLMMSYYFVLLRLMKLIGLSVVWRNIVVGPAFR